MPSIWSSPSQVALLHQLSTTTTADQSEGSHSKRLYTFVHYEHSSHPRRWVILFFVIISVTLAFGWLLAGLVRLRQTASYSESCAMDKVQCRAGLGLTCSLASSLCLCSEQSYWNEMSSKCEAVKNRNDHCSKYQQCDAQQGLICHSNGTCQCAPNTYYMATSCVPYLSYGTSCLSTSIPPCNTDLGLVCNSITQTCLCPTSTYWSRARCESAASYYGYCSQNITCNLQVGLFCRLPGSSSPSCDCPLQSKLYTCDCTQGYAWVTATTSNSTSACVQQQTYMSNCTSDSQCPQAQNLACINGTCGCTVPLWFWSWNSGQCVPCESQGYKLIHYQSQWVCTRLISSSLMSYTASQSACSALDWLLISPIFAVDIPVIAQAYPTYRLWMNMQTSLGSSIYTNIRFPTNQSNWNAYVSTSLSAVYTTYIYALQLIATYNKTILFEANSGVDTGHALCALY